MPCDYGKYPANWKEIRASILSRANNRCEKCGLDNYAVGYRNWAGAFVATTEYPIGEYLVEVQAKVFQIVLTIAHLDHDVANNSDSNLLALCQKCHNGHDAAHRAEGRKGRRR